MRKLVVLGLLLITSCSNSMVPESKIITIDENPIPEKSSMSLLSKNKHVRRFTLKSEQVIYLSGEINNNIDSIITQLDKLNENSKISSIYLFIDSPGGSVLDGAKLVSAIEVSKKPVYTVCTFMCASMAAVIHQYGKKRFMFDRSLLMFHDAAGSLQGPLPQMRSRLDFFDRLTTKMDAYISKRAGITLESFLQSAHSEIWIDAEDSTNKKFNDEIVYIIVDGEKQIFIPPMMPSENYETDLLTLINSFK